MFTRWLGGRRRDRERMLPLSELLRQRATDEFSRRRGEREIEAVVDEVAQRLKPLIKTRFGALPENEVVSCLQAVADTFHRADLTDDSLFEADLDPARLSRQLRKAAPPAGFSELGERLYDVALEDCARCFTQFVVQTAPFTGRAQVEILARLSEITDLMSRALQRLTMAAPDLLGDFLPRYREFLVRKLNGLELVGLDTQFRPRTAVDVAYISLAVSGDKPSPGFGAAQWDPAMLRHARPDETGSVRVEQALARRTRTLIRGEAGAGKSTLLRWLAVTAAGDGFTGPLAEWNGRVPFLIKLRSWPGELPAPEQFLSGLADPIAGTMPPGWVHEQMRDGRALLLVDGVDEVARERRPRVRLWLRDLLDAYPEVLVVVTSRPPAAPVRWLEAEDFDSLALERLAPADVRALIAQWHQAARTSPSLPCPASELFRYEQTLLTQLAANRHLYRLAGNPLLAAMLCALNLDRQTHLPADRMGIYQAAVDMMLHRRDTERGVPSTLPEMTARERLQLLQDLAWRVSLNNRSELSRAEAEDYLSRRLAGMPRVTAPAEDVLIHLVERSGVLRSPAVGRIDFVHRTFQEYLAAREAAEQNMGGLLAAQAHLDSWREIIVMAAGHGISPMRTELIRGILARADREPRHRRTLLLLAAACLETMPSLDPPELLTEIDTRLSGLLPPRSRSEARSLYPVGDPVLRRLPTSPDGLTEAQAAAVVRTAALVNGPRAMRLLAGFAGDPRGQVQKELARSWMFFDPEEYARQVLSDAPLDQGRLSIEEPALLAATRHLRHLKHLNLSFTTTVDLEALPEVPALEHLYLTGGWRGPLSTLHRFPRLSALVLNAKHRVTGTELRSLEELAELTWLSLFTPIDSGHECIPAVARLRRLRALDITLGSTTDISPLAALGELQSLRLTGGRVDDFGVLAGLSLVYLSLDEIHEGPRPGTPRLEDLFPWLEELRLYNSAWPAEYGFLVHFAALSRFIVTVREPSAVSTIDLPPSARELWILNRTDQVIDLTSLARFSGLRMIHFGYSPTPLDFSSLRRWTGGPVVVRINRGQRIVGGDDIARSVRIRRV